MYKNMLGTLTNPYSQDQVSNFGKNSQLPATVNAHYQTLKGNPPNAHNFMLQYPNTVHWPTTINKSGESQNVPPSQLPQDLVNVKFPQYSSVSHALIENDRIGVQLGEPDVYRDTPYQDWTYGIQYYTIYQGTNPKNQITPVIYPQAFRKTEWAQGTVNFPQVNQSDVQDITDLDIEPYYSCKSCDIASASLGTPVLYSPRNPSAPLPVAAYPGEWPAIGQYTGRELGSSTRDWPPPQNPIIVLQQRNAGIPTAPILPDYNKTMLDELRWGFNFS
jgi:hypothetical protein